ncbi:catalase [Bacillus paranthracis]
MNEHYDKQRQSLLGKDFNENGERNEQAILHSQTVGSRGPVLEQDSVPSRTLQQFIREKILERPVHVKGFGAFGYFSNNLSNARTY